jgi:hypothetical protein
MSGDRVEYFHRVNDALDAMEPIAKAARRPDTRFEHVAEISIAISLKRIADALSSDSFVDKIEGAITSGMYNGLPKR